MAHIAIVTPAGAGKRNGNRHTALRWATLLRGVGHKVSVAVHWDGKRCDALLALHARRSHESILEYRTAFPSGPLVVVLTGTDLYRDLPASREARRSLEIADRIVVLQSEAKLELERNLRARTRIVYQSANPSVRHSPPGDRFRVAVVGHLREEKDPFRTAAALWRLRGKDNIELVQVGEALSPEMKSRARNLMKRDPRYRWLGGRTHPQTLAWIARSHVLVVSSVMEGGANVICEAARIGTPVLASRVSGNIGMLGGSYPGYFPLFDENALALLLVRILEDGNFRQRLKRSLSARRGLFTPSAERAALARVLREVLAAGA